MSDDRHDTAILREWTEGLITLKSAAETLGIEPEDVIELARREGLKVPAGANLELFRIRDVNYVTNNGNAAHENYVR